MVISRQVDIPVDPSTSVHTRVTGWPSPVTADESSNYCNVYVEVQIISLALTSHCRQADMTSLMLMKTHVILPFHI